MIKFKKLLKNEKGETFIEVLAAVTLLAVIAGPLLSMVMSSYYYNRDAEQKTKAAAIAQMVMDEVKSKKNLSTGDSYLPFNIEPFKEAVNTKLQPYYKIENVETGKLTPENDYTYDYSEADEPDLELIIEQGKSGDNNITKIELKALNEETDPIKIDTGFNYRKDNLVMQFEKNGSKIICGIGKSFPVKTVEFTPASQDCIKLKLSCKNDDGKPNSDKQLKVFTYSDQEINLKAYVTDGKELEPGVCFINKSSNMEYEINYMETKAFNYGPINELLKIVVEVRKKDGTVIYTASSYVKKVTGGYNV
ncbi:type IV pilus modification PilV family protein [Ruminiclostridium cellulolyticum]|uniref:Uncharacterized protein n=1 Tax=Ruminiclostridium cellulolyticum (strain ATCC 35319 / DSM 5812 / JCM 6584 / H10) TaxID=394503 RepID=B8I5J9_RUMCH|nr:hypothetical protein [Ruminiclostridium cellulolyticum]ACL76735.1 hypothetical protein Ccel_2405 [Ruminiclostridium cellulolyticum H10]